MLKLAIGDCNIGPNACSFTNEETNNMHKDLHLSHMIIINYIENTCNYVWGKLLIQ